ncbi:MAG: nuclear transport factor 2 family protein [Candidatus Polarisedimenticolaceae bacterium]|nr:nuclear transport factor 2 family protein [Candidatus Polarisedimenticolaceae bacterium]
MNTSDKKHNSHTPDNWDEFRPETLLFATEICMMNRDTKVIGAEDNGGYGSLAGTIVGFIIMALLLGLFQFIDQIQAPPQNTFKDYAPWKSTRIAPVTQVAVGPPTPSKPAVVAAPPKPPAPKPEEIQERPKTEEATKTKVEAEAGAAEAAARAEQEAKAAEEAARAEQEAKAAEEAARAEQEAKAAEEAARAEEEARAAEAAARAKEEARIKEAELAAANHRADILNTVKSWAKAWSDQRVDEYIDSYTADFKPQQYKNREYWEAQRRKRLSKPSSISIQLSNIQVSLAKDGTATATFVQIYKSPTFSDNVRKTLILRQESGGWKISSETSKKL